MKHIYLTLTTSYKYILLLAVLLTGPITSFSQSNESTLEVSGFVRNYTGLLINSGDFSILQNTLDLTIEHKKEKISFLANPFLYEYPNGSDYFNVRELYVDIYGDKIDLRIGKQQIIWGQADGVFITDIVSPLNLTEFLLWDFNEIRMGVNAVNAKYYPHPDHAFEFVWIPFFTPSLLPGNGSIWKPSVSFPAPASFDYSNATFAPALENSEIFMRYSLSKSAIDLQLIGAYTWDDIASMHINKEFDTSMNLLSLQVSPQHHRMAMVGSNFSTTIAGFILRCEAAYYQGKNFQSSNPKQEDALIEKDYLNYVVGLDRTVGNWKLSSQFIQKHIMNYDEFINTDKIENLMTLMVNRTLMREQIRLELFSYVGFNNSDALIRIRAFYFPQDGLSLELGTNLFVGDQGQFGQYNNNSMLYTKVKYSF